MNEEGTEIEQNHSTKGMDMLHGPLLKKILLFALPIAARSTLIRIYTVDPVEIDYAMKRFLYVMPFLFLTNSYEITGSALME